MNTINFLQLLEQYKIEIPIIQRDYAQGRSDEETENKRMLFLESLHSALVRDKPINLDFIYGDVQDGVLQPLDGQQRLTTLFLLHWYIAAREKPSDPTIKQRLNNFSYETRVSSREFCEKLITEGCELGTAPVSNSIENAKWWVLSWKADPTIKAMLCMLDAIANKFVERDLWQKLEEGCVSFINIPLVDFGLSDDLYVKMNARGKQLTHFENWKADLLRRYTCPKKAHHIAARIDNQWSDYFFKQSGDHHARFDELMMCFINRYYLHSNQIDNDDSFKYFYADGNDTKLKYYSFERYAGVEECLEKLEIILNNLSVNNNYMFLLNKNITSCVPTFDDKGVLKSIKQKERVYFHALCCYLEKDNCKQETWNNWYRVVRNVIENANINTIESMKGCMRLIKELSKNSHDILSALPSLELESGFSKHQVTEEKEKAQAFVDHPNLVDLIQQMEDFQFFEGQIRFLYRDNKDKVDWSLFKRKSENAKEIFDKEMWNDKKAGHRALTKSYVQHVKFNHIKDLDIWRNEEGAWKELLIDNDVIDFFHDIFMNNLPAADDFSISRQDDDEEKVSLRAILIKSGIMQVLESEKVWQLKFLEGHWVLRPVQGVGRNTIAIELKQCPKSRNADIKAWLDNSLITLKADTDRIATNENFFMTQCRKLYFIYKENEYYYDMNRRLFSVSLDKYCELPEDLQRAIE